MAVVNNVIEKATFVQIGLNVNVYFSYVSQDTEFFYLGVVYNDLSINTSKYSVFLMAVGK